MKPLTWRVSIVTGVVLSMAAASMFAPRPSAVAQVPRKKKMAKEKEPDAPPPRPTDPKLIEIKASKVGNKRLSEFNLTMQLKPVTLKEAPKAPAKAPAKKG